MQDIPVSEVRVEYTHLVGDGNSRVLVSFFGGVARCTVQPDGNVSGIRWNLHDSGGGLAGMPQPDFIGLEQACAGHMSEAIDESMSAVREVETTPLRYGHVRVLLESPGIRAACIVDAEYNVINLKFLPNTTP